MYGSPWTLSLSSSVTVGYIGFKAMLLMHLHLPLENVFFYVNILVIKRVFDNAKHRLCVRFRFNTSMFKVTA